MNIKEFIEYLSTLNPDMRIYTHNYDEYYDWYQPIELDDFREIDAYKLTNLSPYRFPVPKDCLENDRILLLDI